MSMEQIRRQLRIRRRAIKSIRRYCPFTHPQRHERAWRIEQAERRMIGRPPTRS